jgi:hypothetical protein
MDKITIGHEPNNWTYPNVLDNLYEVGDSILWLVSSNFDAIRIGRESSYLEVWVTPCSMMRWYHFFTLTQATLRGVFLCTFLIREKSLKSSRVVWLVQESHAGPVHTICRVYGNISW